MLTSRTPQQLKMAPCGPALNGLALRYLSLLLLLTPLLAGMRLLTAREALPPEPRVVTQVVEVPQPVYIEVPVPSIVVVHVPTEVAVASPDLQPSQPDEVAESSSRPVDGQTAADTTTHSLPLSVFRPSGPTTFAAPRLVIQPIETVLEAPIAPLGTVAADSIEAQPETAEQTADQPAHPSLAQPGSDEPAGAAVQASAPPARQVIIATAVDQPGPFDGNSDNSSRSTNESEKSKDSKSSSPGNEDSTGENGQQAVAAGTGSGQPLGTVAEIDSHEQDLADSAGGVVASAQPDAEHHEGDAGKKDGGSDQTTTSDSLAHLDNGKGSVAGPDSEKPQQHDDRHEGGKTSARNADTQAAGGRNADSQAASGRNTDTQAASGRNTDTQAATAGVSDDHHDEKKSDGSEKKSDGLKKGDDNGSNQAGSGRRSK